MFKKKNKKTKEVEVEQEIIESEEINVTSKDISEALIKTEYGKETVKDKPSKFFSFKKSEPEDNDSEEETELRTVNNSSSDEFNWANSPEFEEKLEKDKKWRKRRKKNKNEELELDDVPEKNEEKKELSTYFETPKGKPKKLKRKDRKAETAIDSNKKGKRKSRKDKLQEDIKNQKLFKYNNKKYTKVEDFITYLNEHYLDIETISEEVLDNENFFGWINKNSGMFNQSLKEYKEIKAKIENKS